MSCADYFKEEQKRKSEEFEKEKDEKSIKQQDNWENNINGIIIFEFTFKKVKFESDQLILTKISNMSSIIK